MESPGSSSGMCIAMDGISDQAKVAILSYTGDGTCSIQKLATSLTHKVSKKPLTVSRYERVQSKVHKLYEHTIDVIPRGHCKHSEDVTTDRVDIPLSSDWCDHMAGCPEFAEVQKCVHDAISALKCNPSIFWDLMLIYPNAPAQVEHADNADAEGIYATLIMDISSTQHSAHTAVVKSDDASIATINGPSSELCTVFTNVLFGHDVLHYDTYNDSDDVIVKLIVTLTTNDRDMNREVDVDTDDCLDSPKINGRLDWFG